MKLTFLGGADEIGASGTLIEIDGRRILVDCGLRHHKRNGDTLPWLAAVQDAGGIDAIILTHAHLDHSGALPVAHRSFKAPIFMTAPTRDIVSILLSDATKIMEQDCEREGDIPHYSAAMVEAAIAATRKTSFLDAVKVCEGVSATFYPAGHILGASSVVLESAEGSVMISGDIYAKDQLTVPGLMMPQINPDGMILECTYGNRLHVNRAMEERRLLEQIQEVIKRGGITLIPAFAVGRSQEVLLILLKAIEQGQLPRVPVFIDGLVRQICSIYPAHKDWCGRWLRKRIKDLGNPFVYRGGPAQAINSPRERLEIIKHAPAIIVASSGMLSGGPSQLYASLLAEDARHHIALCGYNDEESPGRKLLAVAEAGGGEIKLGDRVITPKCSIGMYRLSAHSDSSDLAAEARTLKPKHLFLVHGEDSARAELSETLRPELRGEISLPVLGTEALIVRKSRPYVTGHSAREYPATESIDPPASVAAQKAVQLLRPEDLVTLANMLLDRDGPQHAYTVREIMSVWGYSERESTSEEIRRIDKLLNVNGAPFIRDRRRAFLYLVDIAALKASDQQAADRDAPMPIAIMLKQVDQVLPPETGLYRKSYTTSDHTIRLMFYFPKIAQQQYAEQIAWLAAVTKWQIVIHQEANHERLKGLVREILPASWGLQGDASIYRLEERAVATVDNFSEAEARAIAADFEARTGYRLEIIASNNTGAPDKPVKIVERKPPTESRLEINQALSYIKKAFDKQPHQPLKLSLKSAAQQQIIELAFITPRIGQHYLDLIEQLEAETGWSISIKPTADEYRVKQLARELASPFNVVRDPSLKPGGTIVRVKVTEMPGEAQAAAMIMKFYDDTDYELIIE